MYIHTYVYAYIYTHIILTLTPTFFLYFNRLHSDGPRFDSEAIQSEKDFQKVNKNSKNSMYNDEYINGDGNHSFSKKYNNNGNSRFINSNDNDNHNDVNDNNNGNDNDKKNNNNRKNNDGNDDDGNDINGVDGQMESDHLKKGYSLTFGSSFRANPKNLNTYVFVHMYLFICMNRYIHIRIIIDGQLIFQCSSDVHMYINIYIYIYIYAYISIFIYVFT
jgi:hypothetical protein